MNAIVHPDACKTGETYLKISGAVIEEDLMTTNQLEPLVAIVNKWNDESDNPLVQRLLESVKIDGIWVRFGARLKSDVPPGARLTLYTLPRRSEEQASEHESCFVIVWRWL